MENKQDIVKRLKLLLMATRAGSSIEDLVLNEKQDEITIIFRQCGRRRINVAGDSGIAIIKDVVSRL